MPSKKKSRSLSNKQKFLSQSTNAKNGIVGPDVPHGVLKILLPANCQTPHATIDTIASKMKCSTCEGRVARSAGSSSNVGGRQVPLWGLRGSLRQILTQRSWGVRRKGWRIKHSHICRSSHHYMPGNVERIDGQECLPSRYVTRSNGSRCIGC